MPPLARPARIQPVSRLVVRDTLIAVPAPLAPAGKNLLDHLLFALKHEPIQLPILQEALRLIPAADVIAALRQTPTGAYIRRAAWLWEQVNGQSLPLPNGKAAGNYIDFFDDKDYITGKVWVRCPKFRVQFNGIGPLAYCPVVPRDACLIAEGEQILQILASWTSSPDNRPMMDRIMSWVYLSEAHSSFAIERETSTPGKEAAFLRALSHLDQPLSESYLVDLQNMLMSSPFGMEASFRHQQNWLQRGGHGALAVRYIPPPPEHLGSLMDGLMQLANAEDAVPPLIKAALISFGFVYLHPFMDGNGRLSRLLMQHTLRQKRVLPDMPGANAILPLSVIMKQQENDYLQTLEAFSQPLRSLWDVRFIDQGSFHFEFRSTPFVYAHWQGGAAARFITRCARQALQDSLMGEAAYLKAYDRAYRAIDQHFDLPDRLINLLIQWIHQNDHRLPNRRKKQEDIALRLSAEDMARIEQLVSDAFEDKAS
ncbi:MAG: Fic family protein [Lautropia sp.]|nr:Fic family protein [Lautropia sp.]